jgi:hypothetical protein
MPLFPGSRSPRNHFAAFTVGKVIADTAQAMATENSTLHLLGVSTKEFRTRKWAAVLYSPHE